MLWLWNFVQGVYRLRGISPKRLDEMEPVGVAPPIQLKHIKCYILVNDVSNRSGIWCEDVNMQPKAFDRCENLFDCTGGSGTAYKNYNRI